MNIGIDIGTSYCKMAVKGRVEMAPGYPPGQYLKEMGVTILPAPGGDCIIPSVLWWHPDEPQCYVVGHEAKRMAEEGKAPLMSWMRSIGTTELLMLNGRAFTAMEVVTLFLRHLKEWAETATGQTVDRAVIAHPVYLSLNARDAMLKAAHAVGLNMTPESLVMNPCAAALAYMRHDTRDPLRVMTYDLGGGTFDVAVMEKREGVMQMMKFDGDLLLGGHDFDNAFVQWILDQLKARGIVILHDENNEDHRARRARMLQIAETVKTRLSEQRTDKVPVTVQVDFLVDDQGHRTQFCGQINQQQYAELIREDLQKTIQCCRSALDGAGMQAEDLHAILLVGGSTYGPWVINAVDKAFGQVLCEPYYPDFCVAAGAALMVAELTPECPTRNERIKLDLDYPLTSVLDSVSISGSISPSPGSDLTPEACCGLQVHLEAPDGRLVGPVEINAGGKFIFRDVELLDDGAPSHFKVLVSEYGMEVLCAEGSIDREEIVLAQQDPNYSIARCSLSLRCERLVPIIKMGDPLPVKCQIQFRRVCSGPRLEIPVFLEDDIAGSICVEGIPEEAGEGCLIVVDMEATLHAELRGKVLIYASDNKTVVKEDPVFLSFMVPCVPELSELLKNFNELKDQLEVAIVTAPPLDRVRLAGPGRALVMRITQMIEVQAPDRQVLREQIKELYRTVNPPPCVMYPPRRVFEITVSECREFLAANPEDQALNPCASVLDRIELAGREAYAQKDHRKWIKVNETLQWFVKRIESGGPLAGAPPTPHALPTPLLKIQAMCEIEGLRADLRKVREACECTAGRDGRITLCDEAARRIDAMSYEVARIQDDVSAEQGLTLVRLSLHPFGTLRKQIGMIDSGAIDGTM